MSQSSSSTFFALANTSRRARPPFSTHHPPTIQVRVVYFDAAETILDDEVKARLGMESRFDEPSAGAPRVKRTGTSYV